MFDDQGNFPHESESDSEENMINDSKTKYHEVPSELQNIIRNLRKSNRWEPRCLINVQNAVVVLIV